MVQKTDFSFSGGSVFTECTCLPVCKMLNSLSWGWDELNDEIIPWVSKLFLLISPVLTGLEIVASLSFCKVDEFSVLFQRILSCSFSVILFFKIVSFLFASYRKSFLSIGADFTYFLFASYRKSFLSISADFTYSLLCFIFFALTMLLIILLGFHCRVLSKRVKWFKLPQLFKEKFQTYPEIQNIW